MEKFVEFCQRLCNIRTKKTEVCLMGRMSEISFLNGLKYDCLPKIVNCLKNGKKSKMTSIWNTWVYVHRYYLLTESKKTYQYCDIKYRVRLQRFFKFRFDGKFASINGRTNCFVSHCFLENVFNVSRSYLENVYTSLREPVLKGAPNRLVRLEL